MGGSVQERMYNDNNCVIVVKYVQFVIDRIGYFCQLVQDESRREEGFGILVKEVVWIVCLLVYILQKSRDFREMF